MFYLGSCHPDWLSKTDIPLFVSRRSLEKYKRLPRAAGVWALDSGGFTELLINGRWNLSASEYVKLARRFVTEIGNMKWAAPQDWMCEPFMLEKTGKSVKEHQELTVNNFIELKSLAPDVPFIPVLQGWDYSDYFECVDLYSRAGVDLTSEPIASAWVQFVGVNILRSLRI